MEENWHINLLIDLAGIRYIGWAFRWILRWRLKLVVAGGVKFYPSRRVLEKIESLEKLLDSTEETWAAPLCGQGFMVTINNPHKITKLLLPNPESKYLKILEDTTDREGAYIDCVRTSTKIAKHKNIPVKWFDEFTGISLLIGDRNIDSGWVHIEPVLPYSKDHKGRPCIRIYKKQQPDAFENIANSFDKMWDAGTIPTNEMIGKVTSEDELLIKAKQIKNNDDVKKVFFEMTDSHECCWTPDPDDDSEKRAYIFLEDHKVIKKDENTSDAYMATEYGFKLRRAYDRFSDNGDI